MNIKNFAIDFLHAGKPAFPAQRNLLDWLRYAMQSALFAILVGCSYGYALIVTLRVKLYQVGVFTQITLARPVISVGNLTTGGTGKTPMVLAIARLLQQRGQRVAILSRGYQRQGGTASQRVTPDAAARDVGDEPLLMLRALQGQASVAAAIFVGRARVRSAELALQTFQPDVFVLDDGFQHLQVARTCDIVLLDATNPFGGGRLLPAGFLREPLRQLARADAFVITRSDEVADIQPLRAYLQRCCPDTPIFIGRHAFAALRLAGQQSTLDAVELQGKRVGAVAAIGNPASFHRLLVSLGFTPVKTWDFPDHHWYTAADVAQLGRDIAAQRLDWLATTEKDEAKLTPYLDRLAIPCAVICIRMEIQPRATFETLLDACSAPHSC